MRVVRQGYGYEWLFADATGPFGSRIGTGRRFANDQRCGKTEPD
jgi:hypothetical protein